MATRMLCFLPLARAVTIEEPCRDGVKEDGIKETKETLDWSENSEWTERKVYRGSQLGEGAYGTVFKAYLKINEKFVCIGAVKQPKFRILMNKQLKEKIKSEFKDEIEMAKQLRGIKGVVQIIGTTAEKSIVYELHGGDVPNELHKANSKKLLSLKSTLLFVYEYITILQQAYKKHIVFFDIKPHNTLVTLVHGVGEVKSDNPVHHVLAAADFGAAMSTHDYKKDEPMGKAKGFATDMFRPWWWSYFGFPGSRRDKVYPVDLYLGDLEAVIVSAAYLFTGEHRKEDVSHGKKFGGAANPKEGVCTFTKKQREGFKERRPDWAEDSETWSEVCIKIIHKIYLGNVINEEDAVKEKDVNSTGEKGKYISAGPPYEELLAIITKDGFRKTEDEIMEAKLAIWEKDFPHLFEPGSHGVNLKSVSAKTIPASSFLNLRKKDYERNNAVYIKS